MHRRKSVKQSAFTLVEVLFSVVIFGMMIAVLTWTTASSARMGNVVAMTSTLQAQARNGLDTMVNDIRDSDKVVTSWTNAGTTYVTDSSTTLVLEVPSYNSSYQIVSGKHDHIVYQRVAATGANAPYTINKIVVPDTSGASARVAQSSTILIKNVQSLALSYMIDQQSFTFDGATTSFSLNASPSGSLRSVTKNGTSMTIAAGTSGVQFISTSTPNTLVFGTAPASSDIVDALYSVDSSAGSFITGVTADMTLTLTNSALKASSTQSTEFTSSANLHNPGL